MSHPNASIKDFCIKHFGKLIGKTVKAVAIDSSGGDSDLFFGLEFTDGTVAFVLSDEEGNSGGFLEIHAK